MANTRPVATISKDSCPVAFEQSIVASYRSNTDAEEAVRRLATCGLPMQSISIIGRVFETHKDIHGFYRPAGAALAGAEPGAWFGGIFGLIFGAIGFFIQPAVGGLIVLGPLAAMMAGAIGGGGDVGALANGLTALGVPEHEVPKYQERLQAGEFLVVLHCSLDEAAMVREILLDANQTHLETHIVTIDPPDNLVTAGTKA